jgi:PAS domain S-box-containing protein
VVFWNRGAQELFGYWEDEVLGQPLQMLMPERYRERHEIGFERYLVTGEAHIMGSAVELEGLRKNGTEFPLELSLAEWTAQGERYFTGILRDITARKQAEQSLARLARRNELVLNSAGEGIFGVDRAGNMQFVNPAAASMLGYSIDELLGRNFHDLCHHSRPDGSPYPWEECPTTKALGSGKRTRVFDEVYWRKDGSSFPVSYVTSPIIEEGIIQGAVIVFRDLGGPLEFERAELERLSRENRQ